MGTRLADVAAKRLEEHRKRMSGPIAEAQKAMWDALMAGDMAETMHQVEVLHSLRGPQPWTPAKQRLLERLNKLAAEHTLLKEES